MNSSTVLITEAQVTEMVGMAESIAAVQRGLQSEAAGLARAEPKIVMPSGNGTSALHILGAAVAGLGIAGVKCFVQSPSGGRPLLSVFDVADSRPLAVIEASALSNLRTGALAGIATRCLAADDADELAVIGSGKQAWTQVAAVVATRHLKRIRVWSPTRARCEAFAGKIAATHGIETVAAASPRDALAGALIVTLAARVDAPLIAPDMLARGAHINAIGITVPGRSELPAGIFPRCAAICVDSLATVQASSDEFRSYFKTQDHWCEVRPLAALAASASARPEGADLTLYKGMGSAVADLAMAAAILLRVRANGLDIALPAALEQ
jgi:ornithine cyclodeaminase